MARVTYGMEADAAKMLLARCNQFLREKPKSQL